MYHSSNEIIDLLRQAVWIPELQQAPRDDLGDVVNVVQRRVRPAKVGHTGTLDPLAEGVLVVAVGPASRLVPYVQQQPKHYRATFRLGASSVSGDLEGDVSEHPQLPRPTRDQLDTAAHRLTGEIEQTPPLYSAVWVDGQRAYQRVRAGQTFEMPKRTVAIHSLKILRYEHPEVDLDIVCGSGTYIRSLGVDLAIAAGSNAVMAHLCRHAIGPFVIGDAVSIDRLRNDDLSSLLISPTNGVGHLPTLAIDEGDSQRLGHGLGIPGPKSAQLDTSGDAVAVTASGHLRAIVRYRSDRWCPYRVFPVD